MLFLPRSHLFNHYQSVFAVPVATTLTGPDFPSGNTVVFASENIVPLREKDGNHNNITNYVFIGFSKIFTGGHYLTDVLAGCMVSLAWAGISYMIIETYFVRRNKRRMKNENSREKL